MPVISISHLFKTYDKGKVEAVHDLSLEVEEGEIYGLIGPDGAGKTSLFRMIASLLLPDSGTIRFDRWDVKKDYKEVRRHIGYMPGRFSLYGDLTVEENLRFFASVYLTTVEENYALIEDIYKQIEPFRKRRAANLSGGMKQKLALSCALIHAPRLLLLDEPTTGVDPVSRKEFWDMLAKLKRRGITIMVSTPYMDEALLCDRIALMQDGRLLQVDTPQAIVESYTQRLWAVSSANLHALLRDLRAFGHALTVFPFGETFHVTVDAQAQPEELAAFLEGRGHTGVEVSPIRASVEDCFMDLMRQKS